MYFYTNQFCPPGTRPYTVKSGDTLYEIAERYKTTIPAIISANPFINPDLIMVGQVLCIPSQVIFPPCPERNYYTIKPNDTLYKIARFYNVSLDDLIEANQGINPDRLKIGQIICIPLATPPVTCPKGTRTYVIEKGDTFYRIANKFGIRFSALLKANPGINPDALLIGQKICLPAPFTQSEDDIQDS